MNYSSLPHQNDSGSFDLLSRVENDQTCNVTLCFDSGLQPECCFPDMSFILDTGMVVFWLLTSVIGTTGNLLNIVALIYARQKCKHLDWNCLHNSTTSILLSMSAADFSFCLLFLPVSAITYLQHGWYYGRISCIVIAYMRHVVSMASLLSLATLAFNRLAMLWWPSTCSGITTLQSCLAAFSPWLCASLIFLAPLFGVVGEFGYNPNVGQCMALGKAKWIIVTGSLLPGVVTVLSLLVIWIKLRGSSAHLHAISDVGTSTTSQLNKREMRLTYMFIMLSAVYFICIGPLMAVYLLGHHISFMASYLVGSCFYCLHFAFNFIIYNLRVSCYRSAYRLLFKDIWNYIKAKSEALHH